MIFLYPLLRTSGPREGDIPWFLRLPIIENKSDA